MNQFARLLFSRQAQADAGAHFAGIDWILLAPAKVMEDGDRVVAGFGKLTIPRDPNVLEPIRVASEFCRRTKAAHVPLHWLGIPRHFAIVSPRRDFEPACARTTAIITTHAGRK